MRFQICTQLFIWYGVFETRTMVAVAEARQVVADGLYVIVIQFCQQPDVALREGRTSPIYSVIDLATQVLVVLRARLGMMCSSSPSPAPP